MKIAQVKRKSQKRGKTHNKVLTTAKWKKRLWPHFALWIKTRDNFTCITCGRKAEGSGCHAGHFLPKSTCGLGLYFDEANVNAQCFNCNIWLGGNGAVYYVKMVEKYGQDKVDELMGRRGNITKTLNWEELWERYKNHTTQ